MENAADYTRRLLKMGAKAHKSLGQNFLMDDNVIERIVDSAIKNDEMPLIEVGPGLGVLTRVLARKTKRLWAVELDKSKIELLKRELKDSSIELLNMNALDLKLSDIWGQEKGYLVGNLPYYITSPILMHFLNQKASLQGMTVMVQREVADRLVAKPGGKDYGVLSIAVQVYSKVNKLFEVPPQAFWPAPKVTSAVVQFDLSNAACLNVPEREFFHVVKAAFGQRRKNIGNSLSAGLNLSKQHVLELLSKVDINEQLRAETLTIEDYKKLTLAYIENKKI